MTLAEYLDTTNTTRADFARRVGASPRTVTHLAAGEARPSVEMAARIAKATAGRVTAADWPPRRNGKTGLWGEL